MSLHDPVQRPRGESPEDRDKQLQDALKLNEARDKLLEQAQMVLNASTYLRRTFGERNSSPTTPDERTLTKQLKALVGYEFDEAYSDVTRSVGDLSPKQSRIICHDPLIHLDRALLKASCCAEAVDTEGNWYLPAHDGLERLASPAMLTCSTDIEDEEISLTVHFSNAAFEESWNNLKQQLEQGRMNSSSYIADRIESRLESILEERGLGTSVNITNMVLIGLRDGVGSGTAYTLQGDFGITCYLSNEHKTLVLEVRHIDFLGILARGYMFCITYKGLCSEACPESTFISTVRTNIENTLSAEFAKADIGNRPQITLTHPQILSLTTTSEAPPTNACISFLCSATDPQGGYYLRNRAGNIQRFAAPVAFAVYRSASPQPSLNTTALYTAGAYAETLHGCVSALNSGYPEHSDLALQLISSIESEQRFSGKLRVMKADEITPRPDEHRNIFNGKSFLNSATLELTTDRGIIRVYIGYDPETCVFQSESRMLQATRANATQQPTSPQTAQTPESPAASPPTLLRRLLHLILRAKPPPPKAPPTQ